MDGEEVIRRPHLLAALEIWRYAFESCAHVFGDALGNPKADEALSLLRNSDEGLKRSELGTKLFGKHDRSGKLQQALDLLVSNGLAEWRPEPTGGRPAERWFATYRGAKGIYGVKGSTANFPS
jgi:hypothetical protein